MRSEKIRKFISLAGQTLPTELAIGSDEKRKLGAQLLLSEVLEYVIKGLGVTPVVNGTPITEPDRLEYKIHGEPDPVEMLDGLADVAYTMFWNSESFCLPLETGFERVCDNNLEKFVKLHEAHPSDGELAPDAWHCEKQISWPKEVVRVEVIRIAGEKYAVGKDSNGKVRKPSSYQPVDLRDLLS